MSKSIIILSTFSSGSSALLKFLARMPQVRHIAHTKHHEHETLYWAKAASVLKLPQIPMKGSIVPFSPKEGRSELIKLLQENLDSYRIPDNDDELIFGGWKLLCEKFEPVFVEKSPHHLFQWSCLEIIQRCVDKHPKIGVLLIGLIRNPMDTLYSMWKRWRVAPEEHQSLLLIAYRNLLKLKESGRKDLVIIKYEDIVKDASCLKDVYSFIGNTNDNGSKYFHEKSVSGWRKDQYWGFQLSPEALALAEQFGYERPQLTNEINGKKIIWPIYKLVKRNARLLKTKFRKERK